MWLHILRLWTKIKANEICRGKCWIYFSFESNVPLLITICVCRLVLISIMSVYHCVCVYLFELLKLGTSFSVHTTLQYLDQVWVPKSLDQDQSQMNKISYISRNFTACLYSIEACWRSRPFDMKTTLTSNFHFKYIFLIYGR